MNRQASAASTAPATVLVIDDDAFERALLTSRLVREGYKVTTAVNGREGIGKLLRQHPDIVLLDVVMPELDGWRTLARIRDVTDVPVIMLTGLDAELEQVRGLTGGADDYVAKPYSSLELVHRIKAVLRRAPSATVREMLDDGVVTIDFVGGDVRVHERLVSLTPLERRLLAVFVEHPEQTLSHEQLHELVWDGMPVGDGEVRLYVGYLRRKIEEDPSSPRLIETVRGFGYRYRRR